MRSVENMVLADISLHTLLPHNHNVSLTFLVNFKLSNLNKEIKNFQTMI